MANKSSRVNFLNDLKFYILTHFKPIWQFIQSQELLQRQVNKALINGTTCKVPTRPYPFSLMTLDPQIPGTNLPKKTDTYTSLNSLLDRTYIGQHLPPDADFNRVENLQKKKPRGIY
jgi:prostaglandin-endoperoxide synthase 2